MFKKLLLTSALFIGLSAGANAGIITQSSDVSYTDTDFSGVTLSFDQFDDLGGTRVLDSIEFTLFGELLSTARVENLSSSSASLITMTIRALLSLTTITGDSLVSTLPSLERTFDADVFDGVIDFDETSGRTFEDLYTSNTNSNIITDSTIMSLFLGTGNINTFLSGLADTSTTGGGNILSGFETDARGYVDVVYNYSEVPTTEVSEPHNAALLGLGLAGMFFARRKNKKSA